jgi:circadian clock protein KaiC
MAQPGLVGVGPSPIDVSYLADTVILLRYFEALGRVRKAVSVIKKRTGPHEDTIREITMDRGGIKLGEPLVEFRGVLTTVPEYHGGKDRLEAK